MTGGKKNEQFDIVTQAQNVVDEYEKKYFSCLNDVFSKKKPTSKRAVFMFLALTALFFVLAIKIFVLN